MSAELLTHPAQEDAAVMAAHAGDLVAVSFLIEAHRLPKLEADAVAADVSVPQLIAARLAA